MDPRIHGIYYDYLAEWKKKYVFLINTMKKIGYIFGK